MEVSGAARSDRIIARVERAYLGALRVALLLLATGMILYALWLAGTGVYRWAQNPAAVKQAAVTVSAQEVAAIPSDDRIDSAPTGDPFAQQKAWYRGFVDRYYRLYQTRYQRFRQVTDPTLTRDQFDTRFVGSGSRIDAIGDGTLDFAGDKARLDRLLATMSQVAVLPETVNRLRRYQSARRTITSRIVHGTRTERYCSYYGTYIDMCIDYATREVPTSRTVTEARLPTGVIEPPVLFGRQQARFIELLGQRTEQSQADANSARARIADGNVVGVARLWTALSVAGGFLVLMFLFLLIAIERHQRRLAAAIVR